MSARPSRIGRSYVPVNERSAEATRCARLFSTRSVCWAWTWISKRTGSVDASADGAGSAAPPAPARLKMSTLGSNRFEYTPSRTTTVPRSTAEEDCRAASSVGVDVERNPSG